MISAVFAFILAVVTSALFRLALLLGGLALLVRLKVRIGRVLLAAPVIAAVLFWSGDLPSGLWHETTKEGGAFYFETAALIGLIALIDIFGHILKKTESLPRLMRALQALFSDQRIALGGMPAVIGLLPMPGGAMVSAPAVKEIADASATVVSPEDRTLVNYWFRHTWEYVFPVYPAVVAAAATWEVDLAELAARQAVLMLAAIAAGLSLVLTRVKPMTETKPEVASDGTSPDAKPDPGKLAHVVAIAKGLAPIVAVLAIWFSLRTLGPAPSGYGIINWKPWGKFTVLAALVPVIATLALRGRLPGKWLVERLRRCMPLDMLLLLVGVMVFQKVMEASGAVAGVSAELKGVPLFVVIFALPFIAGLLTGIAVAFVKIAFPLLIFSGVVVVDGHIDSAATVLAYAAGYAGIMLSPVHICLVLTRDYFGANLGVVYRRLALPVAAVLTVAFIVYFTSTRL
jgi:hypothetical protein